MTIPKEDSYVELGEKMLDLVQRLCEADRATTWPSLDYDSDGIQVYSRPALEFPDAQEKMLFAVVQVDGSAEKVFKLMSQVEPYRQQWDELLEKQEVIAALRDNTYLTHTFVKKKLILAARDAIDVVKERRRADGVLLAAVAGVDYADRPPTRRHVRTKQFVAGTYARPAAGGRCELRVLFCADLRLPVPRLMAGLAASFKPRLVADTLSGLRRANAQLRVP